MRLGLTLTWVRGGDQKCGSDVVAIVSNKIVTSLSRPVGQSRISGISW